MQKKKRIKKFFFKSSKNKYQVFEKFLKSIKICSLQNNSKSAEKTNLLIYVKKHINFFVKKFHVQSVNFLIDTNIFKFIHFFVSHLPNNQTTPKKSANMHI